MAAQSHRKYDVDCSAALPAVGQLPDVAAVDPATQQELIAVCYDTDNLALARAGIMLRRHSGGVLEGWHLELPAQAGEREELRLPLGPDNDEPIPPAKLTDLVQARTLGRPCLPVATLRTHRLQYRLRDDRHAVLARLCDDTVVAEVRGADGSLSTRRWRQWEVDLDQGVGGLLDDVDGAIRRAGGRPAAATSELASALGGRLPRDQSVVERAPSADGPAAVVLLFHLRALVAELTARDPQVRRDQPDSVHKMRVCTRRLRSALATFKPLLDPDTVGALRVELKWLAGILGEARDAEVMRDRLTGLATEEPPSIGAVPVAGELGIRLGDRYTQGHVHVLQALGSRRYFSLLESLAGVAEAPPWTEKAAQPADKVLPRRARRELTRLRRHAKEAKRATSPTERDHWLHEVRKSAKRLRYACEALATVFGAPAKQMAHTAKELQEVLGDHQDSVVSQQLLRDLAAHTGLSGEAALVYGRLHLLEQMHAEHARNRYKPALHRVTDKHIGRWLKG